MAPSEISCIAVPHACNDGSITIGQIALEPETGEEVEEFALYLCRRCADDKELDGVRRAGISSWAPASIMLTLAALVSPHRTWHDQVDVVSYAAKFMGLSETGGRGGVGVIRGFVNRSQR
jgi:hypothetical protein